MTLISNSKLIQLLLNFSREEYISLGKWLNSPWANSEKKLYDFHKILEKYLFSDKYLSVTKEALHRKLDKGRAYNKIVFNNMMTRFLQQTYVFLSHQQLRKENEVNAVLLGNALQEKKATKQYVKNARKIISNHERKPVKNWKTYLDIALVEEQLYFDKNSGDLPLDLVSSAHNFDASYALVQMRIYNMAYTYQYILNRNIGLHPDIDFLQKLKEKLNLVTVDLYYSRLSRSKGWDTTEVENFMKIFKKNIDNIAANDQEIFYSLIMSDLSFLCRKGYLNAYALLLEWFNFGISKKLLLQENQLSLIRFVNFVMIATLHGEQLYMDQAINDYLPLLNENIKEEVGVWAKAQILCSKGKPDESLELIDSATFKLPELQIVYRVVKMKSLLLKLEKDKTFQGTFLNYCDAFQQFMRRNEKYHEAKVASYSNFIKYTKVFAKYVLEKEDRDLESFKVSILNDIDAEENLEGKYWLYHKINTIQELESDRP